MTSYFLGVRFWSGIPSLIYTSIHLWDIIAITPLLRLRLILISRKFSSQENLEMRMNFDMVYKKSLPAAKCVHPGRKRSHRFNLHLWIYISNMDIVQKDCFKTLTPARNNSSNILLHLTWSRHRVMCFITNTKRTQQAICCPSLRGPQTPLFQIIAPLLCLNISPTFSGTFYWFPKMHIIKHISVSSLNQGWCWCDWVSFQHLCLYNDNEVQPKLCASMWVSIARVRAWLCQAMLGQPTAQPNPTCVTLGQAMHWPAFQATNPLSR